MKVLRRNLQAIILRVSIRTYAHDQSFRKWNEINSEAAPPFCSIPYSFRLEGLVRLKILALFRAEWFTLMWKKWLVSKQSCELDKSIRVILICSENQNHSNVGSLGSKGFRVILELCFYFMVYHKICNLDISESSNNIIKNILILSIIWKIDIKMQWKVKNNLLD